MPAVFRIILSTVFGGVMGTVCWAAVFWTTAWFFSPETKKPLAVFSVVRGGPIGFVVGAIIGLVVLMTNSGITRAGVIGAIIGTVVAGIDLYHFGHMFEQLPQEYIWRNVMVIVISTAIGAIMSAVVLMWLS